jgi:signal transduction histidine kinase
LHSPYRDATRFSESCGQRRTDQVRDYGKGVVGEAADSGEPVIVENLEKEVHRFNNKEWIMQNHLGSFACIPLVNENEVVGTISIFSGYNYTFHPSIINLLKSLASLIASFVHREISSEELRKLEKQLSEERNSRFISGYSLSREDILHEYKNELLVLQNIFRELKNYTGKKGLPIIDEQIDWTEKRVKNIQGQFEEYVPVPVDINHIIQETIKYFSHELRSENKKIHFEQDYDRQIPRIMANPVEIKEVIRNLASNAIKAIQKIEQGGEIRVNTTIMESKGIDYIQVIIEDNGKGIRNEIKDEVFKKGFTTYENEGGTGIGLFVSRKIVNKYGGQIFHESVVGKGTRFIARLPLRLQEV